MLSKATNNHIKVALLGNPNAGKTSLFNALTGLSQKTGNYSGVTVERYEGRASHVLDGNNYNFTILDLPGVYSLFPKSGDEEIACHTLLDERENIDVLLIVADSTNLRRNLLLATQAIDLKFKTVLALNMIDEAEKQNLIIDVDGLAQSLGVEVVPVNSRGQNGFDTLKTALTRARKSDTIFYDIRSEFVVGNKDYRSLIQDSFSDKSPSRQVENSDKIYRFNIIHRLMSLYVKSPAELSQRAMSSGIDRIVTHRVFGYALLLAILFLVFQFIFFISEEPMNWIEQFFLDVGNSLHKVLPEGQLNDLLVKGVIAGVSGVLMFIPQIAFLFMFIGFLEDSGYMARASFIMDRVMRPFGLNGRSVIPLISGAACAVPSILATRAISNVKERLITIFILPLISCSARLPVYTLLISVLYPENEGSRLFNQRGLVLFFLYILGFVATLITAFFLKRIVKTRGSSFFVMELPVYRWPQPKNIGIMVYNRIKIFVVEAGGIILAISIVLWFLSSHGSGSMYRELEKKQLSLEALPVTDSSSTLLRQVSVERLEKSYIGVLGHAIEPVINPLGFDWKIGIALITSFAAREVFVGTMSAIYQSGDTENTVGIKEKLRAERNSDGSPKYSAGVCWSLLIFYAFALQCMSTIAVVKRETGSWKWVFAQLLFMSLLAYLSSLTVYSVFS